MKAVFLCGALEPGKNGVGDYCRRLASEAVKNGDEILLLSVNDRWIQEASEAREERLNVVRLPRRMSLDDRVKRIERELKAFPADLVSLQYVCYSFDDKGLPFLWNHKLGRLLGPATRRHVMLHELWIGIGRGASLKHRMVGALQKFLIFRMIRQINPAVVHTNTLIYASVLRACGIPARVLPLFSNIPPDTGRGSCMAENVPDRIMHLVEGNRSDWWICVFFGALHSEWEPEPFFSILLRAAETAKKQVCMVAIGRMGSGESKWEGFTRAYSGIFRFVRLGEVVPAELSEIFFACDFGVASSPWALIGKSGSAAAMLEHGLSVVVPRDDFTPRLGSLGSGECDPYLHRCDKHLMQKLVMGLPKRAPVSRGREIFEQFISDVFGSER